MRLRHLLQVARRRYRQCDQIANGFMEARICSISERDRLVFVQNVILNVPHFVVCRDEVAMIDRGALFDAEVLAIAQIPGRCMANNHSIRRFLNDRLVRVAHCVRFEAEILVETIRLLEDSQRGVVVLLREQTKIEWTEIDAQLFNVYLP